MYAFRDNLVQVMLVTKETESTTGYCTFIRGNPATWSKKQDVVSRLTAEVEYRAMAYTICEMIWLKNLLVELDFR